MWTAATKEDAGGADIHEDIVRRKWMKIFKWGLVFFRQKPKEDSPLAFKTKDNVGYYEISQMWQLISLIQI